MSVTPTPTPCPIPCLPCPNCGTNLLTEGFYNSCTETQTLREDNYTQVIREKLYIGHDEDTFETVEHECDLEAFCRECDQLLPWALYEIRGLDGVTLSDAPAAVAELLSQLDGDPRPANA